MRIIHVVSSLDLGGAERLLVDLATEQTRSGHSVAIITLSEGGVLTPVARAAGIVVSEHEIRRGRPHVRLRNLSRVARALRSGDQEVMHSWMYHAGLLCVLLAPRRNRVLVSIHHDAPDDSGMGRATRLVARALATLAKRAAAVVYVSESAHKKHIAAGYPAANASVIPGGVDARRFQPMNAANRREVRGRLDPDADASDTIIVHVARFHPDKDPELMVSAFASAHARRPALRLWLIGRGMERENQALMQVIAEHRVGDAVVLLGPMDAPESVVPAGDIIAVSSRTESFGLALIEGMLSGLAGVSTDVGIAASILDADQLSKPGDPDGLARALIRAAPDTDTQSHRDAALCFGLERMSARFDALYASMRGEQITVA